MKLAALLGPPLEDLPYEEAEKVVDFEQVIWQLYRGKLAVKKGKGKGK